MGLNHREDKEIFEELRKSAQKKFLQEQHSPPNEEKAAYQAKPMPDIQMA